MGLMRSACCVYDEAMEVTVDSSLCKHVLVDVLSYTIKNSKLKISNLILFCRLYEEEMQREKEKQQREKAKKNLHRSLSAPPKKVSVLT